MPNTLGWRRVFGIATPSVNTVVQVEYDDLRPVGVVNHCEGIMMPDLTLKDAAETDEAMRTIDAALEDAIARIATCRPDHMVLGISGESIWCGGAEAAQRVEARIKAAMGSITVTQATDAIPVALDTLGVDGNIGVIHPYGDAGEQHLRKYFGDIGRPVVRTQPVPVTSVTEIAHTTPRQIIDTVRAVDGEDVTAIIQFGANLPMGRIAAAAELWLGKPVIAINVATYWYALRREGISHQVEGYGSLFQRH